MINRQLIYKIIGALLFIETFLMAMSMVMAFFYGEDDTFGFLVSVIVTLLFGFLFMNLGRNASNSLSRRDAYLVVALVWVVFSLFGTMPFIISGYMTNFTDAYFEAMSGFTTTGATMFNDVEKLPHGLLFWRSLMQWIGGLGIVFFTVAVLPSMVGGSVKIFAAEATGPMRTKLHPRLSMSAKWLWVIYLLLTVACAACFKLTGMGWFDGVNHAMTTTATGGFSTHNEGLMFFQSSSIEYVGTLFCFISGINFTLLYLLLTKLRVKQLFQNAEFRFYLWLTALASAFIMVELIICNGYDILHALRSALFTVVSFVTTTGLYNDNIGDWPHITWAILAVCMFVGGCAGSTSGGFKAVRCLMLLKTVRIEFRQILHPSAVLPLKINGVNVPEQKRVSLLSLFTLYMALCVAMTFALMLMGIGGSNSLVISLSCLSNVGPTLGTAIGQSLSWVELPVAAKWLCSAMMLVGRLEILSVLVIFTRAFWREN